MAALAGLMPALDTKGNQTMPVGDVMTPEPLPPGHPLWTAPRCYVTPHTAGGRFDQDEAIVKHFLGNLAAFEQGGALADQVV